MGWKTINGRSYYYRSRRQGGRVRSEYVGPTGQAELFALLDAEERQRREAERERERADSEAVKRVNRALAGWFDRVESLAAAALFAAGFRRHNRGEWRRSTMARTQDLPASTKAAPPATEAEVDALLDRAGRGDQTCLPELRALFSDPERGPRLLRQFGSPAKWLIETIAKNSSGKDLAVREALRRKVDEVRKELEGPDPSPMERLLAERAAVCWLQVNICSTLYEQSKDLTIRQADFQQRNVDRAHRRFLSAVRTLATVRKLALPSLQINVAQNQVNVG